MKIVSYKKKKNNLYEIMLSNNSIINLYDDVILKYELLLKRELDDKLLEDIIQDNSNLESYYVALKYVNTKLRTEKEIRKKLNNYSNSSIDYTINRLKNEGYLNEELYIKSYINDEINLKLVGQNKILNDLKKIGFKEIDILDYLSSIDNEIFLNKIDKFINNKINTNHNYSGLILKQKIISNLISKGFNKEDIYLIIDNYNFSDNIEIYEKEYNKLKNKLSKKYNGKDLEYRIKNSLLKKGFTK